MMSKFPFAFHSVFLLIISSVLLISCNPGKEERDFDIHGTWALERIMLFDGEIVEFPGEDNSGWLRVYDDSCFYECKHPKTIIIHGKKSCKENCNYRCNHVNHYG